MGAEAQPSDQRQRDSASGDLSESYVVEAAAGTGKTTLLVRRILNLIKAGKAKLDEIVAITFLEKAAAELKVKLRRELEKEAACTSDRAEKTHLAAALFDLERMPVTTIHSFCASILRERPVEAGLDPNFEIADALTSSFLEAKVWDEWLERVMNSEDRVLHQAILFGVSLGQMQILGKALLNNRDMLSYLPALRNEESDTNQFIDSFRETMAALNTLLAGCKKPDKDKAAEKILQLNETLRRLEYLPVGEERSFFLLKEANFASRENIGSKGNWKDEGQLEEVRRKLKEVSRGHQEAKEKITESILAALARRLIGFIEAYECAKQERNVLDFQDLLIRTRNLLRDRPEVRRYFRNRYKYLLVDEFQDTDPLQAEIVFFLAEKNGGFAKEWKDVELSPGHLFLVGDPKQSIYRFRRADIEMYEEARRCMGQGRQLTISSNFRSTPSLIRIVNKVFEGLIKPPEDGGRYQPGYVPLHFGRKAESIPSKHGVVLLYPPPSQETESHNVKDCRDRESCCIAAFIQKAVNEEKWEIWDEANRSIRPVALKDIAILLQTYTPLGSMEEALRSYGIDYRVIGGKHFYQRQEVAELLSVLRAVDNPDDKIALLGALRSPFFGISDEELFLFSAEGGVLNFLEKTDATPLEQAFRLLRELHEMRNRVSVASLLNHLYEQTKALVLFLLKPQGEQRVANLLKIRDLSWILSDREVFSFRSFVRWLSERQEEEAEEGEPPTLEGGDNFVRILTIHKAKGLEFPVVILPDLANQREKREDFIIDRQSQRIAIKVGDKRNHFWTTDFEKISQWEERRSEAEFRRLFYVGMTRARDFLILPVFWRKDKNGETSIPEGSFLNYLQPHIPCPPDVPFGRLEGDIIVYDTRKLERNPRDLKPFRHPLEIDFNEKEMLRIMLSKRDEWKRTQEEIRKHAMAGRSLATATERLEIWNDIEESEDRKTPETTNGNGALFGSLVHRLFERLDWNNPKLLEKLAQKEGRALGAPSAMVKKAVEMVSEALKFPIIQRAIKSANYQKEVPFAYKNKETINEGVIDLVFKEEDGLVVLDFKTDEVEREDLNLKAEHYKPQVYAYSEAIETIFGQPPKEVILFFLHPMEPVSLNQTEGNSFQRS